MRVSRLGGVGGIVQCSAPRCTPPMPPVTNTPMPTRCAINMVALTVVAPLPFLATMGAMSRRDALATGCSAEW